MLRWLVSFRSGVVFLFAMICAWSPAPWAAPAPVMIDAGVLVTKVDIIKKQATLAHGKKGGLKVGIEGGVYPLRIAEGAQGGSIVFDVRIAIGKVVKLDDDSAVIALEAIADTVKPGDYFNYEFKGSEQIAQSPLFRVTALGVEITPQYEDKLFITLEDVIKDPSEAARNKVLDAMIADIKAMRDIVAEHLKEKITEGEHHGKTAAQIVDGIDRKQLNDFLTFVEAFPGKYIARRWKFPEIYFTWVINGTPSGERDRKLREIRKPLQQAYDHVANGKLDLARASFQAVLKTVPDHEDAADSLKKIDKINLYSRRVAQDPDDTATGYTYANDLFNLGAYDLVAPALEPLRKRKYDPFKVDRLRAQVLVRKKKYAEAEPIFKKLATGENAKNENLLEWLAYTRAHAKIAKAPTDATGYMELAEVQVGNKSWDQAIKSYRNVLSAKKVTPKQLEIAKAAQEKIALRKALESKVESVKSRIRSHDIKGARESIAEATKLLDKLADDKLTNQTIDDLAEVARVSSEEDIALELNHKNVQLSPTNYDAHNDLAFALLGFDRISEAEAAAKKGLEQKGSTATGHLYMAYIARAQGDYAAMEKWALKATATNAKYSWPMLVLARAEAARGEWQEALVHAKKAMELESTENAMRSTLAAAQRGLQASEALAANTGAPRERLRLVRALAELGLSKRVAEEIAKLPADGDWRTEGWWALAASPDHRVLLAERLVAARNAKPTAKLRKQIAQQYELRTKLRANPKDTATRLELARSYVVTEDFDLSLATLGSLLTESPLKAGVGDLVRDAREGIKLAELITLSDAASARKDFAGADRLATQAQLVHDRIGTSYGRQSTRQRRANTMLERGQYIEAIAILEEAIQIANLWGDEAAIVNAAQHLGGARSNVGTLDARRKVLEDSIKYCESRDDEISCYYLYLQLGSLERDDGRQGANLELTRKAWNLAEKLGRADLARNARFEVSNANLSVNRLSDAEQIAVTLLADSRKADDVLNEQLSLLVLGYVQMMRGNGTEGRGRFQDVYDLGTRTGDTAMRAQARRLIGSAWLTADHEPAKAAAALQAADELYASLGDAHVITRAGVLREMAEAHLLANKLPQARKAAEQALAVAAPFQRVGLTAAIRAQLAYVAIKEKRGDEALAHAQAALASGQKTDDDTLLWKTWYAMAMANELKGNDQAALDAYDKALDFVGRALQASGGDADKKGFMNTGYVRDLYSDAVARMIRSGNTARAMEILELSRDAMLKQQFDPTQVQTKDVKLRARLDKYEDARSRVSSLQKQLDKAMEKPAAQRSDSQVKALSERIAKTRQELNQVVLDLKVTHRHLFQALAMDPQNLVGRRGDLPKGSVLVEYFVADDALYAFIISASLDQPAVVKVKVTGPQLEKTIEEWREALIAENEKMKQRDKVVELGRQLEDWLLEPLRPHLEGATSVMLMPFGPLFYVPFDALVVSDAGQPVRYAIEDYRMSIQTASTLEYVLKPSRARGTGSMLAISNPDGSLPGAQAEVSRIVKMLPDARVLNRKQATVAKFKDMAGGYRYLHLATHGILDADPRKSHMKMSDGPLTVQMIAQLQGLDTSNEMVVLSACDTAVEAGKSTGDELVSVAVAFSMAGSPALVASLWEVSDESTGELMAMFYRALESTKGDRLDALREAKLSLLRMQKGTGKPYAQPWHWASFQMYGDYRSPGPAK